MSSPKILVTPRSMSRPGAEDLLAPLVEAGYTPVFPTPGALPTKEDLMAHVRDAVGWVAGVEPIDADVLAAATQLKAISRNGAGSDAIDAQAAAANSISVLTAAGSNARGVAELTIGLALMGMREAPRSADALRDGRWERAVGREAPGRVFGVLGLGAIGSLTARLATALGFTVIGHDPYANSLSDNVEAVEFDELLDRSEILSIHRPPAPLGPVIGERELALVGPRTVLINTSRSSVIDEDALLAAIKAERVSFYAVDAFETEPPEPSELLLHPAVFPTPHLGAATKESSTRAAQAAVSSLLAHLGTA